MLCGQPTSCRVQRFKGLSLLDLRLPGSDTRDLDIRNSFIGFFLGFAGRLGGFLRGSSELLHFLLAGISRQRGGELRLVPIGDFHKLVGLDSLGDRQILRFLHRFSRGFGLRGRFGRHSLPGGQLRPCLLAGILGRDSGSPHQTENQGVDVYARNALRSLHTVTYSKWPLDATAFQRVKIERRGL